MLCAMDLDSLETLSDGVILLDCHGQILDFNRAAKPWLASTALAAKAIGDMVEQVSKKQERLANSLPPNVCRTQPAETTAAHSDRS